MYHSGIGGGGFMLVRDANGNYEAIDFRESAPAAAYEDMYSGNVDGSIFGGLSVAVPGEVAGLEYAHRKYGVSRIALPRPRAICRMLTLVQALPWETVVRGAIHIARDGFKGATPITC